MEGENNNNSASHGAEDAANKNYADQQMSGIASNSNQNQSKLL